MSDTLTAPSLTPTPTRNRLRLPETLALIIFLLAEVIFFSVASKYFLSWDNFVNIFSAVAVTGILAAGATILLIGGQFDLSIGSGVAWVGLMFALTNPILGTPAALLISFGSGLLIGVINGFLVTVVGVNALITTLGTMAIFRGLTISIGQGQSIGVTGFDWALIRPFLGIPLPVILFVLVAIVVALLLRNTVYGRSIYAIGANPSAARLVGLGSKRNIFIAFLISGLCMALAGLTSVSQLGATSGTTGLGMELAAITAVILGGTSLTGGVGSMSGTVLGLLIVAVLGNGMTLLNINSSWQQVATGILLILAVSFDRLRQRLLRSR
ncbi:ABC transporter permease [Microbacterium sp. LWH3-1.2]|uniref:ABC transporter permease n=1 Tax=Microbacterium sp. LWH3-1.2 TaxID=3135256 RepID=UPI0034200296